MSDTVYNSGGTILSPSLRTNAYIEYLSPLDLTNVFQSPLLISYSAKTEGTWTKITNLSPVYTNDITFSGDTLTILSAGRYYISLNCVIKKSGTGDRFIGFSFAVNETDADKGGVNDLTLSAGGTNLETQDWIGVTPVSLLDLNASDTLKLFINQINPGGSPVQDMEIGHLAWIVYKL